MAIKMSNVEMIHELTQSSKSNLKSVSANVNCTFTCDDYLITPLMLAIISYRGKRN